MAHHAGLPGLDAKEVLTREGSSAASHELAQQIVGSDFDSEIIIAMVRDSLLPAGALSYTMGVKLSGAINVEFYTGVAETLSDPVLLEPLLDAESISGCRLLVVNDVADSGCTLHLVLDPLKDYGVEVRSTVFYGKSRSEAIPDYVWKHIDNWVILPWLVKLPIQKSK